MNGGARCIVPNARDVAHEAFDDEVILIHFPSGRYFRLDEPGRVAWRAIEAGATPQHVSDALRAAFDVEEERARASADAFLATLAEYGLVAERDGDTAPSFARRDEVPREGRMPFREPRLEVFTDLEQLFLVDPIHDVDASGWPHARA